ncbi:MAG: hypothetical protein DRP67_04980 [Candidatus Omnitrophota bacterium]|nr:MAG: hypothetical protein DRP67_04980 [Candidatus Omnitrophota bacterium]
MRTYLDCIPCFFRQAIECSRIVGLDEEKQKLVIDEVSRIIPNISLSASPPEMGRVIHQLIKRAIGKEDPFKEIKEKSNRIAKEVYPLVKKKVTCSKDPLLKAVEISIAGNIIDYAVNTSIEVEKEIEKILKKEEESFKKGFFHFDEFKKALKNAKDILLLGDNAGEIFFDKVLIETIKTLYGNKEIIYAVRGKPVINDVTVEDALFCGIDKIAKVIPSGSDAPGTILNICSEEFKEIFKSADMVISKGQGNFESLSEEKREIFFLLMVKCDVVAKDLGTEKGDIILLYNKKRL